METLTDIKSNKYNGGNTVLRLAKINEHPKLPYVTPYVMKDEESGYYLEVIIGNSDYRLKVTEEKTPFIRYFQKLESAEKAAEFIRGY